MSGAPTVSPENVVEQAILSRRSVRSFLPTEISRQTIRHLLEVAARAPSGSNTQPWNVHVLSGKSLAALSAALTAAFEAGETEQAEYQYYPRNWRSPYIDRRRAAGWALFEKLGIARGDRVASGRHRVRNYSFFGAPVAMVFTIDNDLEVGSWLDFGTFLQNFMIAARARNIDTCPQQSIANFPKVVRAHIRRQETQVIMCGMAVGYANLDYVANDFRTERQDLDRFVMFHD